MRLLRLIPLLCLVAALIVFLTGCKEDPLKPLRDKAEAGDLDSQYNLGMAYHAGDRGVPADLGLAFKWYSMAAEKGHVPAAAALGYMYKHGLGVGKNLPESLKQYLKAAQQDDEDAAYELGISYAFGHGAPIDYIEAYAWFLIAGRGASTEARDLRAKMANDHVSRAELRYQTILRGISKVTFKRAEAGGVDEKLRHGMVLLSLGDYPAAMNWFLILAKKGNPVAQRMLGIMYLNGLSVPQNYTNYVEAYAWFNLAVAGGDVDARVQVDKFTEKMSPELVVLGQARSRKLMLDTPDGGINKK